MIRTLKMRWMPYLAFLVCLGFSSIWSSGLAQGTIYVSGTITGKTTWSADTVKVTGNVSADTLIIESGTVVEFQGAYGLTINNYLNAEGSIGDTVLFTKRDTAGFSDPDSPTGGWEGIFGMAGFTLNYCKIQYVKRLKTGYSGAVINLYNSLDIQHSCITNNFTNGIFKEGGKLNISNSTISKNRGKGILDEVNGLLQVQACIFRNNNEGGIHSYDDGKLYVENSIIESNGIFGIRASEPNMLYIDHNSIQHNNGSGILVHDLESPSRGIISNNIIKFNNGYGFNGDIIGIQFVNNLIVNNKNAGIRQNMGFGAGSIFINNTIINNSNGLELIDAPLYMYNCICRDNNRREGEQNLKLINNYNKGKIYNNNIEGFSTENFLGEFINNMDLDPLFMDTSNFDFHLSDSSPCINTGTVDTAGLFLPETDIEGKPRIANGWLDMGAYESVQLLSNQPPLIEWIQDQVMIPGKTKLFNIKYTDPDPGDQSFVLSVSSHIPQIKILDTIDHSSSVSFKIISDSNWQGDGQIQIQVADNHGNVGVRNIHVVITKQVCGAILENTLWDADTIKVICDVTVASEATLTIKPGTVVEFANGCLLNVYGSIIAAGNKDSVITFTSSDTTGFYDQTYTGWKGINLNDYKTAEFRYCNFLFAMGEKYGGALYDGGGNYPLRITNCKFSNNSSKEHGGAVYLREIVSEFENNVFINNRAKFHGGAVYLDRIDIDIVNSLFYNNQAETGGAISAAFGTVRLINNTLAGNIAEKGGGGAYIYHGSILNCILWGNESGNLNDQSTIQDSGTVGNCIIEKGEGGISYMGLAPVISDTVYANDPAFVNKSLFDFHLTDSSVGINSGTADTTGLHLPNQDLDGNPRVSDGRIDIGAYEYHEDNIYIIKQPVSQVICEGTAATMETEALGGVIKYQWQKNGDDIPSATQRIIVFDAVSLNDSGYYNCMIRADDKTVSTDTVKLTINKLPLIGLGEDTIIYINQDFMLGPYPDSHTYLWNDNSENHSFEVSGNDLGPGSHIISVIVTDTNTCKNSDTINVDVVSYTKTNTIQNNDPLHIFPNPTSGLVNIKVSDFDDEDFILKVFNQQSQEILSDKLRVADMDGTIHLNMTSYPAGIYYLQIITEKRHYFGKIILQ